MLISSYNSCCCCLFLLVLAAANYLCLLSLLLLHVLLLVLAAGVAYVPKSGKYYEISQKDSQNCYCCTEVHLNSEFYQCAHTNT